MSGFPRIIDPADSFDALVDWFHDDLIVKRKCPGVIIGLSGTDGLVAYAAAHTAFKLVGKPHRVWGVHFAPSQDFLYDHPEAEAHTWFEKQVLPWVAETYRGSRITVDTTIDWRMDGVRWGMLSEMGAVTYEHGRKMRAHEDRFWVIGTRNRSEALLFNYSNASMQAGFQPLTQFWKSEILVIARHLGFPQIAVDKSCDVDCICGRERLPAHHIQEVDWLLMNRECELDTDFVDAMIQPQLKLQLKSYIMEQIKRSGYKRTSPVYVPRDITITAPIIRAFEDGTLNLREFDHRQHLFVAWYYLKQMPAQLAVSRFVFFLGILLKGIDRLDKLDLAITWSYFERLDAAMKKAPGASFDEVVKLL